MVRRSWVVAQSLMVVLTPLPRYVRGNRVNRKLLEDEALDGQRRGVDVEVLELLLRYALMGFF